MTKITKSKCMALEALKVRFGGKRWSFSAILRSPALIVKAKLKAR